MKSRLYWEGRGIGSTLIDRLSGSKLGELLKRGDKWVFCHLGRDVISGDGEAEVKQIASEAMTGLLKSGTDAPKPGPLILTREM